MENDKTHTPYVGVDPSVWLLQRAEAIDNGERFIPQRMEEFQAFSELLNERGLQR